MVYTIGYKLYQICRKVQFKIIPLSQIIAKRFFSPFSYFVKTILKQILFENFVLLNARTEINEKER